MLVQIKLRDSNAAYSDNGIAISGSEPMIIELTPFVCGLLYRNEAEIFESAQDKVNSKDANDFDSMSWIEVKKLAMDNNLPGSQTATKKQLIKMLKDKTNEPLQQ